MKSKGYKYPKAKHRYDYLKEFPDWQIIRLLKYFRYMKEEDEEVKEPSREWYKYGFNNNHAALFRRYLTLHPNYPVMTVKEVREDLMNFLAQTTKVDLHEITLNNLKKKLLSKLGD